MRITSITITNLAGFAGEVKFDLPAVAILQGRHGAGKSSLERVLMYLFGLRPLAAKGQKSIMHDPGILHGNAEEGSAIVSLDDGPLECVRVRVTADSTKRTIKTRGKKAWEDAGQIIYDITSALAYNPMAFRDLEPKERLEAFLRVVPIEISREEVEAAVAGFVPVSGNPTLDEINAAHTDIYRDRTAENTSADAKLKYAAQLESTLPPAIEGGDWGTESIRLRADLEAIKADGNRRAKALSDAFTKTELAEQAECTQLCSAIDEEINAKILALKQEQADRRAKATEGMASKLTAARSTMEKSKQAIVQEVSPKITDLTAQIATADERARTSAQAEGARQAAKAARDEAEAHKEKSKSMTEALDRLTELKASVGGRMKIKGVTVASPRVGLPVDICREENGALVPFSRWNDADADQFCLRMAVLFRGPCGLVCVDNMGNWSPERRERVVARCRELAADNGMQFLLGLATDDGDLSVVDAGGEVKQ